ncbi:uncharacterized protein LOC130989937 isoform X2 [Salvia miltiorrhiza]|uniref:uncharacterized protein LOC130989937 isoform X2 n=1 Tax=Salvia miltiorrhiza TaxID=226208 RepID=UPI0025AC2853|nr:uncharacterized protein LOC130989937 isoform X2 [Salvia miltiorrhiza]XP_057770098.1 uncharacterized protein LOC130989937 isoform X2 [Salvia miltiorrhiza]
MKVTESHTYTFLRTIWCSLMACFFIPSLDLDPEANDQLYSYMIEQTRYWCSFGPENYGEGGGTLPSRRYRLNTRNRAARPQSMRGCTCNFVVKRLYARPSLVLLIYNERRHVNKAGFVCHGPLDKDAIGPGAKKIPYVCSEIQQQTMSMIYLGIPEENVLEKHIEGIQRYCGSDPKVQTLASQYVQKLGMIIKRSTHELDLDDEASIRLWAERNKKSIFFYRDTSENEPFILGIQTEWQLQQMIRFGHRNIIAVDSTFGIKRLKYPLCTLLVFDSREHVLPVAWIITRSIAKPDVAIWMKSLLDRVHSVDPGWKANGILIDDAAAEIEPIREIFSCPVLFSLWRVRRSWLRHVVQKCTNIEVQREIFKRLGQIVYGIWGGMDLAVALEELLLDFVDQTSFMQYFKDSWLPKIEMWLKLMKTLPLASQEASGAIEAYHVKLKTKLYDDSHLGSLQRVDWLVHKLTTELHSSYWLDRYADESDLFPNVKDDYIASTSWHRALQIPDTSVSFDEKDQLFAKVLSQKDSSLSKLVWNPGSEFAHCDCEWSLQGNLCKHVVKVNMICGNMPHYQSSLSFQSLKYILMDLWKKPIDDSVSLDLSTAWTFQILDEVQKFVELNNSNNIGLVVNNMPLKWAPKRARTSSGRQSLALPGTTKNSATIRGRKRKGLHRLR